MIRLAWYTWLAFLTLSAWALSAEPARAPGAPAPSVYATLDEATGQIVLRPTLAPGTKCRWRDPAPTGEGTWISLAWIDETGTPDTARVWVGISWFKNSINPTPKPSPTPTPQPKPGPTPGPPTPTPAPGPLPDPKPIAAKFVYLIHESANSTPETAAVRDDKTWKDRLDTLGIRWKILDVDEATKLFPNAAARARATGLPAIVLQDEAGNAVAETCPGTKEAMLARVNALTGAKP